MILSILSPVQENDVCLWTVYRANALLAGSETSLSGGKSPSRQKRFFFFANFETYATVQRNNTRVTQLPGFQPRQTKYLNVALFRRACQLVVWTLIYCQWRTHKRKGEANLNAHGKRWNFYLPEEYGPIKNETENEVQLERVKLTGRWRDNLFVFWVG